MDNIEQKIYGLQNEVEDLTNRAFAENMEEEDEDAPDPHGDMQADIDFANEILPEVESQLEQAQNIDTAEIEWEIEKWKEEREKLGEQMAQITGFNIHHYL